MVDVGVPPQDQGLMVDVWVPPQDQRLRVDGGTKLAPQMFGANYCQTVGANYRSLCDLTRQTSNNGFVTGSNMAALEMIFSVDEYMYDV